MYSKMPYGRLVSGIIQLAERIIHNLISFHAMSVIHAVSGLIYVCALQAPN